jgi:hypothetical protein
MLRQMLYEALVAMSANRMRSFLTMLGYDDWRGFGGVDVGDWPNGARLRCKKPLIRWAVIYLLFWQVRRIRAALRSGSGAS